MNAYHDKKKHRFEIADRMEWNSEQIQVQQNLKFPENMMEITRCELFLHENNLIPVVEALKTWIIQNTALRSKHEAKN